MSSDNQRTPAPLPGDRKPEFNGPETPLTAHPLPLHNQRRVDTFPASGPNRGLSEEAAC